MKSGGDAVRRLGGQLPQADAPAALFVEGLEKLRRARIIGGMEAVTG